MNTKKNILALFLAFVVSNLFTTIWYMLTDEANYVPYRREEMNYGALMLNHLIYAGLMLSLFPYYYKTNPKLSRGFVFGSLIAALMFLPQAIVVRAIWEVDFNTIFVLNTMAHIVIGGIMGILLAFIYNYKNPNL